MTDDGADHPYDDDLKAWLTPLGAETVQPDEAFLNDLRERSLAAFARPEAEAPPTS